MSTWGSGRLAGLLRPATVAEMDLAYWRAHLDANLTSGYLLTRAAQDHLADGSDPGIVLTSSIGGFTGGPGDTAYSPQGGGGRSWRSAVRASRRRSPRCCCSSPRPCRRTSTATCSWPTVDRNH